MNNVIPIKPPLHAFTEPAPLRINKIVYSGAFAAFMFFGVAGGWAALAPLDSAAVASGFIKVAGEKKMVQHLEGGLVKTLNAANGDVVKAGQVLIKLDSTMATAKLDLLRNRIATREALAARLRAERDDKDVLAFNAALLANTSPAAMEAVATQRDIFEVKLKNLRDEQNILTQRRQSTAEEITGLEGLIANEHKRIEEIDDERVALEGLLAKGLTTREKNLLLIRAKRELEGDIATQTASIARAKSAMAEIDMQILNLKTKRMNESVDQLSTIEAEIFDLRQEERAAKDVLTRTEVTAPVGGIVMDLKVHTTGGVIQSGEELMSIVPLGELEVEAQVKPEDIETIATGQEAHVNISAFARYNLAPLNGTVKVVSADRLVDERTGVPYFSATVVIPESELAKLDGRKLMPGMTSEVMIKTGARTMVSYLGEPIMQNFRRALKEK